MLDSHIEDDLKNGRTIVNPSLILESLKGDQNDVLKRKSALMQMFYENTQIYETDQELRYAWQPEDMEDKGLISKKLHQYDHMPQVDEESGDVDDLSSRSQSILDSEANS